MLTLQVIFALAAVAALGWRRSSTWAALLVLAAAAVELTLGAHPGPALSVVVPLLTFLTAALTLAAVVDASGLTRRVAAAVATFARGNTLILFVSVCTLCALLTAVVSLDGAVVLMVPLLLALDREYQAPFAPLFLGVVVVANTASISVPQGNPTNLVVMSTLGLSTTGFLEHMLLPGLAATAVCIAGVAVCERRALAVDFRPRSGSPTPLSGAERHAAVMVAAAALAAWTAPIVGIEPWWPFATTIAIALIVRPSSARLIIPWRLSAQVGGLTLLVHALGFAPRTAGSLSLAGLLALAVLVGAAAALANNLPVSVSAASLLAAGAPAYAAAIGLALGALATPQGSIATLIASDLAGSHAPPLSARRLAPLAAAGVLTATLLVWWGL